MSTLFVDTSALAKRYIAETGSRWLINRVRRSAGNVTVISMLTTVEVFSLLARRQREGILTVNVMRRLGRAFLKHVKTEYLVFPLDDPLLGRSRNILTNHPLRTLDAIQLACAWEATLTLNEPLIFISADQNLLSIAGAEGFPTDNPNLHP